MKTSVSAPHPNIPAPKHHVDGKTDLSPVLQAIEELRKDLKPLLKPKTIVWNEGTIEFTGDQLAGGGPGGDGVIRPKPSMNCFAPHDIDIWLAFWRGGWQWWKAFWNDPISRFWKKP